MSRLNVDKSEHNKKKLFLLILDFMTSERDNIDILCEQEKKGSLKVISENQNSFFLCCVLAITQNEKCHNFQEGSKVESNGGEWV